MSEIYDDNPVDMETPTQEEILMNESDLLRGLIEAGKEKDNENI